MKVINVRTVQNGDETIILPSNIFRFKSTSGNEKYTVHEFSLSDGTVGALVSTFKYDNMAVINPKFKAYFDTWAEDIKEYASQLSDESFMNSLYGDYRSKYLKDLNDFLSTEDNSLRYQIIQSIQDNMVLDVYNKYFQNNDESSLDSFKIGNIPSVLNYLDTVRELYSKAMCDADLNTAEDSYYPGTSVIEFYSFDMLTAPDEAILSELINQIVEKNLNEQCSVVQEKYYDGDKSTACVDELKEVIDNERQQLDTFRDELDAANTELGDLKESQTEKQTELDKALSDKDKAEADLANSTAELNQAILDKADCIAACNPNPTQTCIEDCNAAWDPVIEKKQSEVDTITADLEQINTNITQLQDALAVIAESIVTVTATINSLEVAIAALEAEAAANDARLKELQTMMKQISDLCGSQV